MKTEGQVRHKLKQVLYRHLKKQYEAYRKPRPENCAHNRLVVLTADPSFVFPHACVHPERAGEICDREHGGVELAKKCPFWSPSKTQEAIRAEFSDIAQSPRSVVAETMPDAAALMWVLGDEGGVSSEDTLEVVSEPEPEPPPEGTEPEPEPTPESAALTPFEIPPLTVGARFRAWSIWHWRLWPWNWRVADV